MGAREIFLIIVSAMVVGECLFVLMLVANNYIDRRVRGALVALVVTLTLISIYDPLMALMPAQRPIFHFLLYIPFMLIGPAFWAYVVRLTETDGAKLSHFSWGHALPFVLGVLLFCAFLFVPPEQQAIFSEDVYVEPSSFLRFILVTLFLLLLVWLGLLFWYAVQCFKRLRAYRKMLRQEFADIEGRQLLWLEGLGILLLGYWLFIMVGSAVVGGGVIVTGGTSPAPVWDALLAAMHLVMVSILCICGLQQKPAFAEEQGAPPPTAKYEKSALTPEMAKEIAMRIENLMATKQLYLDPILTLRTLARSVGAPPNHVSQTLNETLGTSFFDYVNGWRVKHCLPAIQSGEAPIMTVAYGAGFNSRSAFYNAFKRVVGRNPNEYRRSFQAPERGPEVVTSI